MSVKPAKIRIENLFDVIMFVCLKRTADEIDRKFVTYLASKSRSKNVRQRAKNRHFTINTKNVFRNG